MNIEQELLKFAHKGFPSINIYQNHFEIKDIDHWAFRKFKFSEVDKVIHFNPNDVWWKKLYITTSYFGRMFSHEDPWIFKVDLKNGGDWTYKTSYKLNSEFRKIVQLLNERINGVKENDIKN